MIITIVGTHGIGKSTLSYLIASHYKKLGKNIKIIQEVARTCPFSVNEYMTVETCLWIYHEQRKKELEAKKDHDVVICDRSCFDSFVYADHFSLTKDGLFALKNCALSQLACDYEKIIFVRPNIPIIGDGFRSTDSQFQKSIDNLFKEYLKDIPHYEINSNIIFKDNDSWKKYCL